MTAPLIGRSVGQPPAAEAVRGSVVEAGEAIRFLRLLPSVTSKRRFRSVSL